MLAAVIGRMLLALTLGCHGQSRRPESHVTGADWQPVRTNELLEDGDFREANREYLGSIEGVTFGRLTRIDTSISHNYTDTELIASPMRPLGRRGAADGAPTFAYILLGRREGVAETCPFSPPIRLGKAAAGSHANGILDDAFEPGAGILQFRKVGAGGAIYNVPRSGVSHIHAAQPYVELNVDSSREKSVIWFAPVVWFMRRCNWAIQCGLDGQPRAEAQVSGCLGLRERLNVCPDGIFGCPGTDGGGFSRLASVEQSEEDEGGSSAADEERPLGPPSLIFGRLRGVPTYAAVLLMTVLGIGAGIGVNEGGRRSFYNRREGKWWLAGGMSCLLIALLLAACFS